MARVVVNFSIDDERDKDLLRWLHGIPRGDKSRLVRDTLRAGLGRGGISLGDVYRAVKDLSRKLETGAVMVNAVGDNDEEVIDPDLVEAYANLDKLGL